jgi:poly-gamma-glutamate capsule biosynthesis protein CapA/YwtB (metallophosphatase superfamily)
MDRRGFLRRCLASAIPVNDAGRALPLATFLNTMNQAVDPTTGGSGPITLFLCGDVMTGRGIDQVLPHPVDPQLHEPYMKSAVGYVTLAERVNGPIPKPIAFSYIWGEALEELERVRPQVRLINLETSVTTSDEYWRDKGIHYRMHPDNIPCLSAARIDCCTLANNHVLDWGYAGLLETLETLERAGIEAVGVGRRAEEAQAPAAIEVAGRGRVIVFAFGTDSSGIPPDWAAAADRPGVNRLEDLSDQAVRAIGDRVRAVKRRGDIVVASLHWGGNWGYTVPRAHTAFARRLIDEAAIDILHGHSSHHPMGIEVYRDRPILYGCGDFLNDYEGIGGYEAFRPDLALMYFVSMDPATGRLLRLEMTPMQLRRFRVHRASHEDAPWLKDTLDRESRRFGVRVESSERGTLMLRWG